MTSRPPTACWFALSLLATTACNERGIRPSDAGDRLDDMASASDLRTASDLGAVMDLGAATQPIPISIGSTLQMRQIPFVLDASGQGTGSVSAVSVHGSLGTLSFAGSDRTLTLAGFRGLRFASPKVYELFAIDQSGLFLVSLLCDQSSGKLTQIWLTDVASGVQEVQGASGTCSGEFTPATIEVALPASSFTVTPSAEVAIASPDGKLSLAKGKVGTIDIGGVDYTLIPLDVRDCRVGCDASFVSIASLIVSKTSSSAAFTYVLLHPATPSLVEVRSVFFLPEFEERLSFAEYNATWSMD